MMRRIHCNACGTRNYVPMNSEDVLAGFHQRITHLLAAAPPHHSITITNGDNSQTEHLESLICDSCGQSIPDGQPCVAITMYRGQPPVLWEPEFGQIAK